MSIESSIESNPIAKDSYDCDACTWFGNTGYSEDDLTAGEWLSYKIAESKGFRIIKGERYIRQNNKCDGNTYTYKAIPSIHNICLKYGLYEF